MARMRSQRALQRARVEENLASLQLTRLSETYREPCSSREEPLRLRSPSPPRRRGVAALSSDASRRRTHGRRVPVVKTIDPSTEAPEEDRPQRVSLLDMSFVEKRTCSRRSTGLGKRTSRSRRDTPPPEGNPDLSRPR